MTTYALPARQAFYDELIAAGTEPRFADTLASCRRFPGEHQAAASLGAAGTERPLHEMVGTGDPFPNTKPHHREFLIQRLRQNGVHEFSGGRYFAGLAREPGDPRAFITSRSEIKKLLDERGWGAEGLVSRQVRESFDPCCADQEYTVADDVVSKKLVEYYLSHDDVRQEHVAKPETQKRVFEELREYLSGRGSCPLEGFGHDDV